MTENDHPLPPNAPQLSNEAAQRMVREMIQLLNKGGWQSETDEIDAKVEAWLTDAEYPKSADRAPLPPPQARTPDAEMTKSEHVPKFSIKIEAGESLLSVLTLPGKYFRVYQNGTLLTLTKDSNAVFDLLRKFLAAPEPNYVANSGKLAGISDRVDLTKNSSLSRAESAPQEAGAREIMKELEALRAGARTGMLKFMLAGDVGCFADRMRQLLQAKDWDGMRLTVTDFFHHAADETEKGRYEMDRLEGEIEKLRAERGVPLEEKMGEPSKEFLSKTRAAWKNQVKL